MKQIPLTQGQFALVDDEDFEYLNKHKWYADKKTHTYYANTHLYINKKDTVISMHRMILGLTDPKTQGDHKDKNGLNNQKYNLRICSCAQNQRNKRVKKGGSSKYRGVYWNKKGKIWQAGIKMDGKSIYIGNFADEIEAAKAYDKAAKFYHGEFASLNFNE